MRRIGLVFMTIVLAAACGTSARPQSDQDRDGRLIASQIRSALLGGFKFNLTQQFVFTGGQIPSGQEQLDQMTVTNGVMKGNTAHFTYRLAPAGSSAHTYDMLMASDQLYVRNQGTSAWKTVPIYDATDLFPSLRVDLVREAALLANSIPAPGITFVTAGVVHQYKVKPAPDQLEELESAVGIAGSAEQQFLKTATCEVDVFLALRSDQLGRIEVHYTGTDPSTLEKVQVDSAIDVSSGRVGSITAPADATSVDPSGLLG